MEAMAMRKIFVIAVVFLGTPSTPQQEKSSLPTVRYEPTVSASLNVSHPRSTVGWGSFDLTAHPEGNDIRVDLLLGVPTKETQWVSCGQVSLRIDDEVEALSATYSGVPMSSGVYEAMEMKLTIKHLRRMAAASDVRATVCGETIKLTERKGLKNFIKNFDERALISAPSVPTPRPVLGPEHEYVIDPGPSYPVPT